METILYVHIPKAGGSAVNSFFAERFGQQSCVFHAENQLNDRKADPSAVLTSRFVSAHLNYPRFRKHFVDRQQFGMTVMREPAAQITSHLAWVRYQTDIRQTRAYLALPAFLKQLAQRMTKIDLANAVVLKKFLAELDSRELALFDNCQTRYLVSYINGAVAPGMLKRAKLNLEALDFVGVSESMQDVFDFLSWRFRLAPAQGDRRVNVTQERYGLDPSDPALREVLQPYIALDMELYEHAQRLFGAAVYEMWKEFEAGRGGVIDRKRIHGMLDRRRKSD